MDFKDRIKLLRTEKGELQAEVSAKLGIKANSYSTYENGREPNYDTLIKLAKYFGCTTDYLLGLPDTEGRIVEVRVNLTIYSSDELLKELRRRLQE